MPLRLLLIEDSEDDAALIVRGLSKAGYEVQAERVDSAESLTQALNTQEWDLAIADYTMPGFSGMAALSLLRERDTEMPLIFVSGTIGEDAAVLAMRMGASDYIMKENLKRLLPAVERELREAAGRRSRKRAEARLAYLAYYDSLTDLPNRPLLHDRLQQALLAVEREREPLALLVLDLDGFKTINDSIGHHGGDRVLREVAVRLRAGLREMDTVARLGGDEFAVVMPKTDGNGAMLAARKLSHELVRPILVEGRPMVVAASVGIAWSPEHGVNPDVLVQKADIAMYAAKHGRLGYAVYSPDRDHRAHRRLTLTTELREGIERGEFSFDYQPIVSLHTGKALGVEALARWDHPRLGRLMPDEFIEIAEQAGLIEALTTSLLEKAVSQWADANLPSSIYLGVNVSPTSLCRPDLPERIADTLKVYRVAATSLVLEMTENVLISDAERVVTCLSRLHDLGVALAIDDFGAGYSSLSYLRRLPVDQLKIDRSLTSSLSSGDDTIVRSTIELARNLRLRVVAEGVESAVAFERLRQLACDAAQGLFIAGPGSVADIRRWIVERNS